MTSLLMGRSSYKNITLYLHWKSCCIDCRSRIQIIIRIQINGIRAGEVKRGGGGWVTDADEVGASTAQAGGGCGHYRGGSTMGRGRRRAEPHCAQCATDRAWVSWSHGESWWGIAEPWRGTRGASVTRLVYSRGPARRCRPMAHGGGATATDGALLLAFRTGASWPPVISA